MLRQPSSISFLRLYHAIHSHYGKVWADLMKLDVANHVENIEEEMGQSRDTNMIFDREIVLLGLW